MLNVEERHKNHNFEWIPCLVCMGVCIYIYMYTHTDTYYTHTHIYICGALHGGHFAIKLFLLKT